jgi:hypothetical protein
MNVQQSLGLEPWAVAHGAPRSQKLVSVNNPAKPGLMLTVAVFKTEGHCSVHVQ